MNRFKVISRYWDTLKRRYRVNQKAHAIITQTLCDIYWFTIQILKMSLVFFGYTFLSMCQVSFFLPSHYTITDRLYDWLRFLLRNNVDLYGYIWKEYFFIVRIKR